MIIPVRQQELVHIWFNLNLQCETFELIFDEDVPEKSPILDVEWFILNKR